MKSHISLAHSLWNELLSLDDSAIDATCGNGYDSLFLAPLVAQLYCIDIQKSAIEATQKRLKEHPNVSYHNQSHDSFPEVNSPIKLIVYNLGYLPGGDKQITTQLDSTILSVKNALDLIMPLGMVSIMCYPGHLEGKREEEALLALVKSLSKAHFSYKHHTWQGVNKPPSLLIIRKTYDN